MSRLRLLVFWLLAVAVPLQGFAAGTLLLCAGAHGAGGHAATQAPTGSAHHGAHSHGDAAAADQGGLPAGANAAPDHAQGSACCHAVAICTLAASAEPARPAAALPAEPAVVIPLQPAGLPERPPRA